MTDLVTCEIYQEDGQCCCMCKSRYKLQQWKIPESLGYVCAIFTVMNPKHRVIIKVSKHSIGCECFKDIGGKA